MATSQPAERTAPRLLISYSHDSREHEDRVLRLADRLREDGIDAVVDQYDPAPPDGWPMWMDREIRKADFVALVCTETYLRRVEGREEPGKGRGVLWEGKLIYNHLYVADADVQRFIPILFEGGAPSSVPWPLRGLTYYQVNVADGYDDFYRHLTGQHRHEKPALGKLKALPAIEPQSYPASLEARSKRKPPTSLDQRNRRAMLKRVRIDWIDGVLKQSLYNVARIELGLEAKRDAVEQPLNAIVQVPDRPPSSLPPGTDISQVFDDLGTALLILGAPGTGKTTLLLELAEQLLDRAEQDESHPIPVVFNLSSWTVRRQPLASWLIAELNERSDVPKLLAQRWVENEEIIPLLDGLDEVAVEHRQACAEAINNFRSYHGLLPIAVCSRIGDYEALSTKLRLRNAVVVQPLTRYQVQDYLERAGGSLQPLRAALETDPCFWELLETPLMLWVAMLAYRDATVEFFGRDSLELRRRRLFANFVEAMFKRRSGEATYTPTQTLSWLWWLASTLRRRAQTFFYLENVAVNWLPTRAQRLFAGAGTVVVSAMAGGLILGLAFVLVWALPLGMEGGAVDALLVGLALGLLFGLAVALVCSFADLRPVERIRISLGITSLQLSRAARGVIVGLSAGLIFSVVMGLVFGMIEGESRPIVAQVVAGLIWGLVGGVTFGLTRLLSREAVESRVSPNQGTRRSAKMAVASGLGGGILVGVVFGLMNPDDRLQIGIGTGLLGGLIVGFVGGGLFSLRHLVLSLLLWRNRSAPLRYVRFLDYAAERLFLRKVGGGYIFVHRMLLEYFASLASPAAVDRDAVGSTVAGPR